MVKILKGVSKFVLETLPQVLATLIAGVLLSIYHGHTVTKYDLIDPDPAKEQLVAIADQGRAAGVAPRTEAQPATAAGSGDPVGPEVATAASSGEAPGPLLRARPAGAKVARSAAASLRSATRVRTHQASLAVRDVAAAASVAAPPIASYPLEPNLARRMEPLSPVAGVPPAPPSVATPGGATVAAAPSAVASLPMVPQPVPPAPVLPAPVAAGAPPARVLGLAVPAPMAIIGNALDPRPVIRAGERAVERIADAAESMVPDFHRNTAETR
jgi:hypothetical protein